MIRFLLSILISTLIYCNASGQGFTTTLKENAVKIDRLDSLSQQVYNLLSEKRLIMIGEMHGTNEPAEFVIGLAELFAKNGDSVQIGFEIPSDEMKSFINKHSEKSIYSSNFFSKSSSDGRASIAWANAISRLNKNPRVKLFFYDTNDDYNDDRDSTIFLNIKREMLTHSNWKTITISGNIHNMLLTYKGKNKMAGYLSEDKELNLIDKICSLNHYYQKGTMNNNFGKGLKITDVGNIETIYSTTVAYDNYLFLFPENYNDTYNGLYFTRSVTASKLVNGK
jgi:hypothetical protein